MVQLSQFNSLEVIKPCAYLIIIDKLFFHNFHCIDTICFFQSHQQYFGITSSSYYPEQIKILKT